MFHNNSFGGNNADSPFDAASVAVMTRDLAQPELYPPRVLPKHIRRRGAQNRLIVSTQPIEDRVLFSGFYQQDHDAAANSGFRAVIGKQSIIQELDLTAYIQPSDNNNNSSFHNISRDNQEENNHHDHKAEIAPQQIKFVGTALATFPQELRCHFTHMLLSAIHKNSDIVPGMCVKPQPTSLAPLTLTKRSTPCHFSNYDGDKHRELISAVNNVVQQVVMAIKPRYITRVLQHNPGAKKVKTRSTRRRDSDDEGDGDETRDRKKQRSGDDDDQDNDQELESEASDSSDSESDYYEDFGGNDDDDDDYAGQSGDDEPTY